MIKKFISKYSINLPRTITYMLQSSEYIIPEYILWYKNIRDFRTVENRKKLIYTKKAILIFTTCWIIALSLLYSSYLSYLLINDNFYKFLVPLLIILLTPHLLAYLILIPLIIIKILIQKPLEAFIIKKAIKKLETHSGLRIGIAGSYGKTSMKEILKTILSEKFNVAAPKHSYNTPLGISRFINNLSGNEDIIIFELGEYYPGDIRKLCNIVKPEVGIITGINNAHLQKFKSIKNTVKTILEIADYLKNNNVYINIENKISNSNKRNGFVEYSKNGCQNIKINEPKIDIDGTYFTLSIKDKDIETKTNLLGVHQLGPIAAASNIAYSKGMTLEEISSAIKKTIPFEHRLQPINYGEGVMLLDDTYNGNPDGVEAIINFIKNIKNRRKIYITPGLVEMGEDVERIHEEIGVKLAKANINKVVLIKNSVTPYIEKGLNKGNFEGEIIKYNDAKTAFNSIKHLTIKNDLVVLQNDWPDQYY